MRIALVLANPATAPHTGWPVGFWWSELTHPYEEFTRAGAQVDLYSPLGGACVGDAMSDPTDPSGYSAWDQLSAQFLANPAHRALVETTRPIAELDVSAYDGLLVAGGQSPMFTFAQATALHEKFAEFYRTGKITAALCHGVAILNYVHLDGQPLAKGKTVTGFSNAEEDHADHASRQMGLLPPDGHVMPWRVEDALRALGANYVSKGPWESFAVRDGNLITGQQNMSGAETARLILASLKA